MAKKVFDQPCQLMVQAMRLVRETGADEASFQTRIPAGWLQKFMAGKFQNPSVNRVVHVYKTLTKTKLKV